MVLPAAFPNLLANGATGIAVGMATSIPPHNAGELIDACLLLLQRPDASTADLLERAPGPDFPTGGVIVEPPRQLRSKPTRLPRRRARAGAVGEGGPGSQRLPDRRHRNPLPGEEEPAGRGAGRADRGQEDAAAGRRARRVHRRRALVLEPKSRTVEARGADGEPVPALRPGDALSRQHQRAGPLRHPRRDGAEGVPAPLPRLPPRGGRPAHPLAVGEDRGAAARARRPPDRLPEPGRGDPHRPPSRTSPAPS